MRIGWIEKMGHIMATKTWYQNDFKGFLWCILWQQKDKLKLTCREGVNFPGGSI